MSDKKFYLTTPIYYVNARPHIGHAYTTIVADVLARRHRLLGEDTFFLTGTDEHGQKIERSAAAAGIPPQQFTDQVSKSFQDLWKRMGITNDAYIRTTSDKHKCGVQKLFAELYDRGFIYLASYTGSYCVSDEAFVDAPVGTPCPDCGRLLEDVTEENFFFKLSEFGDRIAALIESNELLITPDSRRNEVLSFVKGGLKDLSISRSSFTWGIPVPEPAASKAAQKHVIYVWLDALANYMTAIGYGSDDPAEQAKFEKYWPADLHLVGKEIIRFHCVYWPAFLLAAGLPLPKAITAHGWLLFEDSKMSKSKGNIVRTETILDAFGTLCPPSPSTSTSTSTSTSLGLSSFAEGGGSASPEPPPPSPESTNRRGTASAVPESPSTEDGASAPEVRLASQADRDLFATDVLRYFLLREIPFGQDGSFSFDALITRYNADLANGYGNLVSRTLKLASEYFPNGFSRVHSTRFATTSVRDAILEIYDDWYVGESHGLEEKLPTLEEFVARLLTINSFAAALSEISAFISRIDTHLAIHKPWIIAKQSDPKSRESLEFVLYTATESIRIITALLYPILPYATSHVWAQLGLGDIELAARNGELKNLAWGGLKPGTKLGPLGPIFPRADKGLAQIMTDMENPTPVTTTDVSSRPDPERSEGGVERPAVAPAPAPTGPSPTPSNLESPSLESPQITIDDFAKIELRVAQVLVAERIPKADKLLRLEVDLGPDFPRRQILSGIAEWYTPEDLIGRRIVVITNLAPRKMRGLESHGMLLAASNGENGKPVLATFGEDIALGSRLK